MKSRTWNRPLPERFLIGGGNRFNSTHHNRDKCWMLLQRKDKPTYVVIEPYPAAPNNNLRVSPIFSEPSQIPDDPHQSNPAYILGNFSWDWVEFRFQPLKQLEFRSLYWVPDSRVICGEHWLTNNTDHTRTVQLDLICSLQSQTTGNQIILENFKGRPILTGTIGGDCLVLLLTQDPVPNVGSYSSLQTTLSVPSKNEKKVQWICTLADSKTTALEVLEQVIHLDWPGEISRLKVAQQGQLEITTGDSEWDFALALSQKQSKLIVNKIPSAEQPETSPDFELSPFQALILLRSIQPLETEVIKKILALVYKDQEQDGKKSEPNRTPALLASELLWQSNQFGFDHKLWSEYLPAASEWLENWFSTDFDTDRDGIPEVVHPTILNLMDSGSEDSLRENHFVPYPYLESPALCALLFNDLCKLIELVRISGTSLGSALEGKKECLLKYLRGSQNPDSGHFQTRDSHSHNVVNGFTISEDIRPGLNLLRAGFQQPTRIGIQYQHNNSHQTPGEFTIILHGQDLRGNSRVEEVHSKNFTWGTDVNWGITESVFSKLDFCTLKSAHAQEQITLVAPSTSDHHITLTLPLWAEILSDEQAQSYIQDVLLDPDQFWSPYGFRTRADAEGSTVQFAWNLLLGQALIKYGKLDQAADLIGRWLSALIPSVSSSGSMYPAYHAETGKGSGEKDTLESLFPVSFFLQVLGIQFVQDRSLIIKNQNPFPWPVKLKFRGVIIECGEDQTTIYRPGQEPITLTGQEIFQLDLD